MQPELVQKAAVKKSLPNADKAAAAAPPAKGAAPAADAKAKA